METNSNFLGEENIRKLFWKLSIPAIISQVIVLIYNIVDRIYLGHIEGIGGFALTGVGICTPVVIIIGAFTQLVCTGGASVMSFALGEKKDDDAKTVVNMSFLLIIILSLVITFASLLFARPILYLFGASQSTFPYAYSYYKWYVLGTISIMLSTGMASYITAQGAAKVAMITVSLGAIANIILDPIFIWTLNLGLAGAAIATILSQTISAVFIILFFLSKKTVVKLSTKYMKVNKALLTQSLLLGLSPFIMQFTECALSAVFNRQLTRFGGDMAVGAMTLFTSINSFAILPIFGFCQGSQSITSYNYGANKYDRVAENIKRLVRVSFTFSAVMWVVIMTIPSTVLGIFTSDGEMLAYSLKYIRLFFAVSFLGGLQPSCQLTFLALKKAKISLFLAMLRKVILLIPLLYILPAVISGNVSSVFLAQPVADTIAITVTVTCFVISNRDIFKKAKVI